VLYIDHRNGTTEHDYGSARICPRTITAFSWHVNIGVQSVAFGDEREALKLEY